ncbi:MAG: bifunctional hydroxymethylpyrimidine kinase/phosphomethylpyrimidine kinase [Anaerolineae bacterium]|nr:bifunctional hydroxymethylpyrimidine kinase/phosphomethylpyrimidine kinase [Anaerolineae bacterium]
MHIVGIGNPVYDYIKTPQIDTRTRILSGCSTNACLAARKLGARATMVGCVGDDFGGVFHDALSRYDIGSHIYHSPETGGFSLIYYDTLGNRTLDVLGQALAVPDVPSEVLSAADFVIIGPILGEVSLDLVKKIRITARGHVLLDPQGVLRRIGADGRIEHYRSPDVDAMIPLCDAVKANEIEAEIITGIHPRSSEKDLRRATERLHGLGCRIAIVTLAAEGSAGYDGHNYVRVPAYATNAVDPTGAGDTYAAGFMVGYLKYGTMEEACYYASCVASVMVENVGPDFPLTAEEADQRWRMLMASGWGDINSTQGEICR